MPTVEPTLKPRGLEAAAPMRCLAQWRLETADGGMGWDFEARRLEKALGANQTCSLKAPCAA